MKKELVQYKLELSKELESILGYWTRFAVDEENGGFVGRIGSENVLFPEAPKGSVLNARILWTFSAAYNLTGNREYLEMATRAFNYLSDYFIDKDFGGVYWTVDHRGVPLDTKKQIYAVSFAVYGLSEYYVASGDDRASQSAISFYNDIITHSYEQTYGGYIEALSRDWKELKDLRLSAKDANERKSMNTHLHVLEGFANLYRVWPEKGLRTRVVELIRIFLDHIISRKDHHLILFFDDAWNQRSDTISYGHDIEAAWLVQEAAETIGDEDLVREVKQRSILLAEAAAEGLDKDGGLWYEYEPLKSQLIRQKHSWPQAEAMVGFFNAWEITGDEKYLHQSMRSWQFVQEFIHDKKCGEWYWGVMEDHSPMLAEDKVGIWKCPYHNSRACIEIIQRISKYEQPHDRSKHERTELNHE